MSEPITPAELSPQQKALWCAIDVLEGSIRMSVQAMCAEAKDSLAKTGVSAEFLEQLADLSVLAKQVEPDLDLESALTPQSATKREVVVMATYPHHENLQAELAVDRPKGDPLQSRLARVTAVLSQQLAQRCSAERKCHLAEFRAVNPSVQPCFGCSAQDCADLPREAGVAQSPSPASRTPEQAHGQLHRSKPCPPSSVVDALNNAEHAGDSQ